MSFFLGRPKQETIPITENELIVYRQSFVASEGQTTFTLANTYEINKNRINVTIEGMRQYSPDNFTETSENSFTLSEGLPVGTIVTVELFK